jgi:hypothetical protein
LRIAHLLWTWIATQVISSQNLSSSNPADLLLMWVLLLLLLLLPSCSNDLHTDSGYQYLCEWVFKSSGLLHQIASLLIPNQCNNSKGLNPQRIIALEISHHTFLWLFTPDLKQYFLHDGQIQLWYISIQDITRPSAYIVRVGSHKIHAEKYFQVVVM